MLRIINKRATGKTLQLFLLAKEQNGIIACSNPRAMREKAANYGVTGLEFVEYSEIEHHHYGKPVFIDELEVFIKRSLVPQLAGYTLSIED